MLYDVTSSRLIDIGLPFSENLEVDRDIDDGLFELLSFEHRFILELQMCTQQISISEFL